MVQTSEFYIGLIITALLFGMLGYITGHHIGYMEAFREFNEWFNRHVIKDNELITTLIDLRLMKDNPNEQEEEGRG